MKKERRTFDEGNAIKKSYKIFVGAALVILISVIMGITIYIFNKDNYYIFTGDRVAEMENRFEIDFDGVKLEKYSVGGYRAALEFYGVEDPSDFIENKVSGEVVCMMSGGTVRNYEENTQKKWDSATAELMKKCEVMYYVSNDNGLDYRIRFFEENNGKYSAEASYSTWGVCF